SFASSRRPRRGDRACRSRKLMQETTATAEPPATLPEERVEVTRIREQFPDTIQDVNTFGADTRITVRREQIPQIIQLLRHAPELQYNFFSECMCVDYLDAQSETLILGRNQRFEVVYNLYSLPDSTTGKGRNARIFIKVGVPEKDPIVPTVTGVYPGAEFPERE